MLLELWGTTGEVQLVWPTRPIGYLLLAFYLLLLVLIVYRQRADLRRLALRQWLLLLGLGLLAFVCSQLFPLDFPPAWQPPTITAVNAPEVKLFLLAAVPFLLGGALLNPVAALLVGLCSGLGRALGQTHQLFELFHFAFAALLAAYLMQQDYRGRFYAWLRQPFISGPVGLTGALALIGLAAFVGVNLGAIDALTAFDLALARIGVNAAPLLIEGVVGGAIVLALRRVLPQLRPAPLPAHRSRRRSLRSFLLDNFVLFATLVFVLNVGVVFALSRHTAQQSVLGQMRYSANTAAAEVAALQTNLRSGLVAYSTDASLVEGDKNSGLSKVYAATPGYNRVLLVDASGAISGAFPQANAELALTPAEESAVARTLARGVTVVTTADSVTAMPDDAVVSFVAPVLGADGQPVSALVGRAPQTTLTGLVAGLPGVGGQGAGFVVDSTNRIIAHVDAGQLLQSWQPATAQRPLAVGPAEGIAYMGQDARTGARELVYYAPSATTGWTVVTAVPYAYVLGQALRITGPLALLLLLLTAIFYARLTRFGGELVQPISDLAAASRTIAEGGAFTPAVQTDRDDEIGRLSRAFAQMQRALKQRLDELSLLLSVSHDVATSLNLNQSMPIILQGALRGVGGVGARAVIISPSGGYPLTFDAGPKGGGMALFDRALMTRLREVEALQLDAPGAMRSELGLTETAELPVQALYAVALYSQNRFQGVLFLGYRHAHTFDASERNLLRTLAGQASLLVDNAHLLANAEGGRRRLAAVLASTSDAVIVTDQTERILLINRAMERAFHVKAGEVMGRPIADVLQVPALVEALTTGDPRGHSQEIPTDDGRIYYTKAATIVSNEGQVLGRVAVLHDVTHFKEVDKMKSEFVATVSHDLRSPLTFMRGYATMLPMVGDLTEKQREYNDKILSGIDQMATLVDDLLDLGRIEAGLTQQFEDLDVAELVNEAAEAYWQHAHLSGMKIEVDLAADLPHINGDRALLRQALANYLGNSFKYAAHSGALALRARYENGEVVISVQDNGPGIAKQDQMRLFEKFYRVRQRGTEHVKGSGLGLAIVKSIAEKHGGRVWCQSQLGKGSAFYLALPPAEN